MKLQLFKTLWGHDGSLFEALQQAQEAGFDGLEGSAPTRKEERAQWAQILMGTPLNYIAEVYTGGHYVPNPRVPPSSHLEELERKVVEALPLNPLFITALTGLDAWDFRTKVRFAQSLLELSQRYEVIISLETHRSRMTYSPWETKALIDVLPTLPLTIDFSHWCCVAERLVMDDEPELLVQLAAQTHHLHARVGYEQGPQVPDPRAPEYHGAVHSHFQWWRRIWEVSRSLDKPVLTITPEFGPDGYLQCEPYSQKPVADLGELNNWMRAKLREKWHCFCSE